jgi:hypothetical protein
MLELRHLGGALARPAAAAPNTVGHRDAGYSLFTSAYPGPAFAAAAELQTTFNRRLGPWSGGRSLYTFTAHPDNAPADAHGAFDAPSLAREGAAAVTLQVTADEMDPLGDQRRLVDAGDRRPHTCAPGLVSDAAGGREGARPGGADRAGRGRLVIRATVPTSGSR